MDSSIILQTELLLVPTQWVIVDATVGLRLRSWLPRGADLDYLPVVGDDAPAEEEEEEEEGGSDGAHKEGYVAEVRPRFIERFSRLYEKGWGLIYFARLLFLFRFLFGVFLFLFLFLSLSLHFLSIFFLAHSFPFLITAVSFRSPA